MASAHAATFADLGFLHVRGVFDSATVDALRADLDALSGWKASGIEVGDVVKKASTWTADTHKFFTPVRKIHEQSAVWQTACAGVLAAQARELMGGPVVLDHALGIVKPPQLGQAFPLHQDGAYYGPADGRCVLGNIYLDDVRPDNGSLHLAPRSHGGPLVHHEEHGKKVLHPARFPTLIAPEAKAGDVVWFHLWTVHGSAPNVSPKARRAVRVGYCAA